MNYSSNNQELPLISIITVVFQDSEGLRRTMQSVLKQDYPKIEHIVIDGGSKDATPKVIEEYKEHIDYWVSEPDNGIYDAMNKGIKAAKGKWINFMNAGDIYFDDNAISNVFKSNTIEKDVTVVYGDVCIDFGEYDIITKAGQIDDMWKGMPFSHQSTYMRTEVHQKYPFGNTLKIAEDFAWFYNIYKLGYNFQHIDAVLARCEIGGVSFTKRINSLKERRSVVSANPTENKIKVYLWYSLFIVRTQLAKVVKNLLPASFTRFVREQLK